MKKNIIAIEKKCLAFVCQRKANYKIILNTLKSDFIINQNIKTIFNYFLNDDELNIEATLIELGFDDKSIEWLLTTPINNTAQEITEIWIAYYKKYLLSEVDIKNLPLNQQEEKIKEINTIIENLKISIYKSQDTNEIIDSYLSYLEDTYNKIENNEQIGIETGIIELDYKINFIKPGDYIVIGARPSMGKTSLALNIFIKAIFDNNTIGIPVFFSIETLKKDIIARMIAIMSDGKLGLKETMFGENYHKNKKLIKELTDKLKKRDFIIEDFTGIQRDYPTIENIEYKVEEIRNEYGKVSLVILDHLQITETKQNFYNDDNKKIAYISGKLQRLSRKHNASIVALSQLNRELEKRIDKRPNMSDLRSSGAIEQDADVIIFLYRDDVYAIKALKEKAVKGDESAISKIKALEESKYSTVEFIIDKNRNGAKGIVVGSFLKNSASFLSDNKSINYEEIIYGEDAIENGIIKLEGEEFF